MQQELAHRAIHQTAIVLRVNNKYTANLFRGVHLNTVTLLPFFFFAIYSFISLGIVFLLAINVDSIDDHLPGSEEGTHQPGTTVSVIIPCRNEANDIRGCIDSVLNQDYAGLEVIVADGNSEDGTWEILQSYGDRIKIIREGERPTGWTGKNWGAFLGYKESRGEILLFVDGDMVLTRETVSTTVRSMLHENTDLLSLGPKMVMKGFWEKLMLPLFAQFIMLLYMPPLMNRDRGRVAMANGQYMMMKREAYEKCGTHRAIREKIVEDVNLAKLFRKNGMKIRFYWASGYLSTRMYRNRGELWEGVVRDIQGEVGRKYHIHLAGILYLAFTFYLPFWMMYYSIFDGSLLLLAVSSLSLVFVILRMLIFQIGTGSPAYLALLFPVSIGIYLLISMSAFLRAVAGFKVLWKDRKYSMTGD